MMTEKEYAKLKREIFWRGFAREIAVPLFVVFVVGALLVAA